MCEGICMGIENSRFHSGPWLGTYMEVPCSPVPSWNYLLFPCSLAKLWNVPWQKHVIQRPTTCQKNIYDNRAGTAPNDVIEQSEIRKCSDRKAFEMINQEFKAQGTKYIVLSNFRISCRELSELKLPLFAHARAVAALSSQPRSQGVLKSYADQEAEWTPWYTAIKFAQKMGKLGSHYGFHRLLGNANEVP